MILRGMTERPQFVDWAEAREKSSGTPFAAATPSTHPRYDSHPVELALLRVVTASAGLRRRRRPLENAAVFVVLLALPLSQPSVRQMGLPAPAFRCGLDLRVAGAHRNAPPTPGRIDARCGAADSCTRSAAGCAQAPRRCRVVSCGLSPA